MANQDKSKVNHLTIKTNIMRFSVVKATSASAVERVEHVVLTSGTAIRYREVSADPATFCDRVAHAGSWT